MMDEHWISATCILLLLAISANAVSADACHYRTVDLNGVGWVSNVFHS